MIYSHVIQFIFSSICVQYFQMVGLNLPSIVLQLGQLWVTCCILSRKQGMTQHGTHPKKQRTAPSIQAMLLGSDVILVVILFWQWLQFNTAGVGPKAGADTYWTWVTTVGAGGGGCGCGCRAG